VHIFSHVKTPYFFETDGHDNWMGKYFFTGGQMPSHQLLGHFQKNLKLEKDWVWNGQHYQKTSEAWLVNCDKNKLEILALFENVYGPKESALMFHRWRIFFLAVTELFGYQQGEQWAVSHYLFTVKD
jgi:cyclopropane-fatty-acyl-phospholipid synthase